MAEQKEIIIDMKVENRLLKGNRAIHIYHHDTRGAHLISCGGSVTIPLKPADNGDYLHISVNRGPGRLNRDCLLEVPLGLDIDFTGEGKVSITANTNRVFIKIPPGPPVWQLKITRPAFSIPYHQVVHGNLKITVGEL